jgi:hypothetical protein
MSKKLDSRSAEQTIGGPGMVGCADATASESIFISRHVPSLVG